MGTRVKKHRLLLFYYLVSNLPKKYCSVLDAINLFAVAKSEDIATNGFVIILESFLNDLKQLSVPDEYPIKKHLEQCSVISGAIQTLKDHYRTSYGINRKSILTEFPHFDKFKQNSSRCYACSLRGSSTLTLQALIKHYIDTKVTNLATINCANQSFPYSYMKITDKPNYIRKKKILSGYTTLNQGAAKCYLLFPIFPFVVGCSINFSDGH